MFNLYNLMHRRNDYPFINDTVVEKFKVPYLVESICFIDMAKSVGRVVSSMDWHPVFSGLVAVSYSFSNLSTTESRTYRRAMLARLHTNIYINPPHYACGQ